MEIREAMNVVTAELRSDAGYRTSWRANIAMAYADNPRRSDETEHEWLNRCAEAFLDLLCR